MHQNFLKQSEETLKGGQFYLYPSGEDQRSRNFCHMYKENLSWNLNSPKIYGIKKIYSLSNV